MASLGKSLIRAKKKKAAASKAQYSAAVKTAMEAASAEEAMTTRQGEMQSLKSIWETSNVEEFLSIASRRETGFTAERGVRVAPDVEGAQILRREKVEPLSDSRDWRTLSESLPIPQRPSWNFEMSADELQVAEEACFSQWRRTLSQLEETNKAFLTPYEKNLEVWRQLWRVVERSDIVLYIVDARNPLAFRCKSFEKYVESHKNAHGVTKRLVMLLNKADLLSDLQRKLWAEFLREQKIHFCFFSAVAVPNRAVAAEVEEGPDDQEIEDVEPHEAVATTIEHTKAPDVPPATATAKCRHRAARRLRGAPQQSVNVYALAAAKQKLRQRKVEEKLPKPTTEVENARDARISKSAARDPAAVLLPEELLDELVRMRPMMHIDGVDEALMVGLVGYPNVGKSCSLNAIVGCKKVLVSATPGKTKHFQTHTIPSERRIALCDSPGLVFPSFASTRHSMVCDGILPIDQMRDYVSPISIVASRIPRRLLEVHFGVQLGEKDDVDESTTIADRLLNIVARSRGYMTEHNKPNRSRAAKEILKLYVDGKFVFVHPPPGVVLKPPPADDDEEAMGEDVKRTPQQSVEEAGEDEWEDLSSADEQRALSDHSDEETKTRKAPQPLRFFEPAERRHAATEMSTAEVFNSEANAAQLNSRKPKPTSKKRANPQLFHDPFSELLTRNREGGMDLAIDSDDGIIEATAPVKRSERPATKRAKRREARRSAAQRQLFVRTTN